MIRVEVFGAPIDLADELEESFHDKAKALVSDGADILLEKVHGLLRQRRGSPATSSPPGQPPESDSDELARSWKKITPTIRGRVARSGVYSNSVYAVRQEYGGTDITGRRLLERPYLRPAMVITEPMIHAVIESGMTFE